MAKVKNVSGEDRFVPLLDGRLVTAGQTVEVRDEDSYAFTSQESIWAPADDVATRLHKTGSSADEEAAVTVDPNSPPARNASTEDWATFAVKAGLATETDVEGKSRDELISLYGPREV